MAPFKVGIDSYCLEPLRLDPFALLEWANREGAEGVQFSGPNLPVHREADEGYLKELATAARDADMYLEWGGGQHVPFDTTTWAPKDLLPVNRRAAEQAHALGATVIRSCSGGFFRWTDAAPPTEVILEAMVEALKPQRPVMEDLGVTLALELHFEFTTHELLHVFEACGAEPGGWLSICLDTFNMLPMLEDPVLGTDRALPWVSATHLKDGGLALNEDGLFTFPTEAGRGMVDLGAIVEKLRSLPRAVHLSLEDHGGSFVTPLFDASFLARFPDLTPLELAGLVASGREGAERIEAGELAVTEREAWPSLCEERTRAGIRNLRELALKSQAEGR